MVALATQNEPVFFSVPCGLSCPLGCESTLPKALAMTVTHPKNALSSMASDHGWLPASPKDQSLTSILATREFDTAVGPKTATLHLRSAGAGCYQLSAVYFSEGRNVLASIVGHVPESSSDSDLRAVFERVSDMIESTVDASYARRLFLRWQPQS